MKISKVEILKLKIEKALKPLHEAYKLVDGERGDAEWLRDAFSEAIWQCESAAVYCDKLAEIEGQRDSQG